MVGEATVKEAGITALVAMVLALPLIGLETVEGQGGLVLNSRMLWVLVIGAAVFVGRLALIAWRTREGAGQGNAASRGAAELGERIHAVLPWLAGAAVLFAVIMPFLPFANRTFVDLATLVLIYVMLGWGLNIVVGLAGLLDLGYVAFYAIGAYSFAMLAMHADFSFWMALPLCRLFSPAHSACCWAFRCCGCAATIWPSSRWASAR